MKELVDMTSEISSDEKKCTQHILCEWKSTVPLLNQKILINCHLTKATLLLVEIFLFSGAEIKITCTGDLVCHEPIKELLVKIGNYLSPEEVLLPQYQNYFDAVLDCGGYLANHLKPKKAFIELTHVETSRYESTNCPVISVDNSFIKRLETTYGTGDGFVRAMTYFYNDNSVDYTKKNYMIFGYGKVGEGICSSLTQSGISKENIIVVETNEEAKHSAQARGFLTLSIYQNLEQVKHLLANSIHCVVTATGVKDSITKFLDPSSFSKVEHLANMGTYDEWGQAFSEDRILNKKRPLNFMLEYPTKILYLDPIFALLAYATLDIINKKEIMPFNIQSPNVQTQKKVLDTWLKSNMDCDIHKEIEQLWLSQRESYI